MVLVRRYQMCAYSGGLWKGSTHVSIDDATLSENLWLKVIIDPETRPENFMFILSQSSLIAILAPYRDTQMGCL